MCVSSVWNKKKKIIKQCIIYSSKIQIANNRQATADIASNFNFFVRGIHAGSESKRCVSLWWVARVFQRRRAIAVEQRIACAKRNRVDQNQKRGEKLGQSVIRQRSLRFTHSLTKWAKKNKKKKKNSRCAVILSPIATRPFLRNASPRVLRIDSVHRFYPRFGSCRQNLLLILVSANGETCSYCVEGCTPSKEPLR